MSHPSSGLVSRRARAAIAALLGAVLLAGCNLAVGVDVTVNADGSGRLELAFRLDEELAASLEADGFDPSFGFDRLDEAASGWAVDVDRGDGLEVRVRAAFDDQVELDERVRALNDQVEVIEDGAILDSLQVDVAEDGLVSVAGEATLVLPATTGATGDGVVFDGDDLRALLDEQGEDIFRAEIRVRMPGPVLDSNADVVDGRTATWVLAVDETTSLEASAQPDPDRTLLLVLAVGLVGLVVGAAFGLARRRR